MSRLVEIQFQFDQKALVVLQFSISEMVLTFKEEFHIGIWIFDQIVGFAFNPYSVHNILLPTIADSIKEVPLYIR